MTESSSADRHWLHKTPTEFLCDYVTKEWLSSENHEQLRKIRYYSFTLRAWVFRGEKLFLTNRNSSPGLMEELSVPTDRFDVTLWSGCQAEPPLYEVNQHEKRSLIQHIRTSLSSRYQHPNILQNAHFLDEFSFAEPIIRRRIEATTYGEEEQYLCDIEVNIVMSKYDGSLGNGPAFRWIAANEAASIDDDLRFVAGLNAMHVQAMFCRFRTCRENQSFHERCKDEIRAALRERWKLMDVDRGHRFGIVTQEARLETPDVTLFTMDSMEAASYTSASWIFQGQQRWQIIGRFAIEAVQLRPEVETWLPAVGSDGKLVVQWRDSLPKTSSFLVLTA